ncbi:methyltransferase domain-containing protein [Anabaena sp. PCC 7108]|uniref:methyltransferase domain-containing protein n=1 Tax=Anabaena sp. PCC 7108 TaxID=163908 RepID=UPI00036E3ADF|nr:methyltransferase domain-containing protein [Anabaena sp. PCC 7108]
MGTSNWQHIPYMVEIFRLVEPQKILDIGVGFGRWGIVAREFLDVWYGKVHPVNWTLRIDGIEAFEPNIEDYQKYFYTNIFLGDAKEKIYDLDDDYDLIIFGDVLEHFTKEDGENLLKISLKKSRYVVVAVPLDEDWEQDEMYENLYEKHLAAWYADDFKSFHCVQGKLFRDYINRSHGVFLLSLNSSSIPNDYIFDYYDSTNSQWQQELLEIKKSRTWKIIKLLKSNYFLKGIFSKLLSVITKANR